MSDQLAHAMAQYGAFLEQLAHEFERWGEDWAKVVRAFAPAPSAPKPGEVEG